MTIESYHNIFLAGCGLAIVFACISIILFVVFDVKKIIGVKTGHEQKKSMSRKQPKPKKAKVIQTTKVHTDKLETTKLNSSMVVSPIQLGVGSSGRNIQMQFYKNVMVMSAQELIG